MGLRSTATLIPPARAPRWNRGVRVIRSPTPSSDPPPFSAQPRVSTEDSVPQRPTREPRLDQPGGLLRVVQPVADTVQRRGSAGDHSLVHAPQRRRGGSGAETEPPQGTPTGLGVADHRSVDGRETVPAAWRHELRQQSLHEAPLALSTTDVGPGIAAEADVTQRLLPVQSPGTLVKVDHEILIWIPIPHRPV